MSGPEIQEHMDLFASDGLRVGVVDQVEGGSIKLTRTSPESGGEHHYVPLEWVEAVDWAVYLNKPAGEVRSEWQAAPVGAGGGRGNEQGDDPAGGPAAYDVHTRHAFPVPLQVARRAGSKRH